VEQRRKILLLFLLSGFIPQRRNFWIPVADLFRNTRIGDVSVFHSAEMEIDNIYYSN
jgi:hypothetical protein